ncbi:MAG: flavin reductase [Rhodospirillaceae bacterium]|nr:flavin reductase [Rhodospirillaceae bacterium]|tara:strand:- start:6157 stop:6672 length:516 start_codon:yes stop_codon:yes gene_type:complete
MTRKRNFSPRQLRDALGMFATGVTIITSHTRDGERLGVTCNSFNSVSLDPPMVLFSLSRQAHSLNKFESCDFFAVNILADSQKDLSNRFARPSLDKWEGVEFDTGVTRCPLFPDSLAMFECYTRFHYDGGDHVIFVGEAFNMQVGTPSAPLLYYQGAYREITPDATDTEWV